MDAARVATIWRGPVFMGRRDKPGEDEHGGLLGPMGQAFETV